MTTFFAITPQKFIIIDNWISALKCRKRFSKISNKEQNGNSFKIITWRPPRFLTHYKSRTPDLSEKNQLYWRKRQLGPTTGHGPAIGKRTWGQNWLELFCMPKMASDESDRRPNWNFYCENWKLLLGYAVQKNCTKIFVQFVQNQAGPHGLNPYKDTSPVI